MGRRGPGARRLIDAEKRSQKPRRRREAWRKRGLSRADRVIKFLESLPITKGMRQGKRMKLLPRQIEFIRAVYDGGARIGIDSAPRGNGKTGMVAALALAHLLGPESEMRGEIYSAAVDRTQSGRMFAEMEAIILAVPDFAARVNIQRFHKKIEVLSGDGVGSIFEALTAERRPVGFSTSSRKSATLNC